VSTSSGPESARVSLAREREPLDRDFVLRWRLAGAEVKSQLLVHGEFAMLSLLPPAREGFLGPARDVVFVLDRSGSMQGVKMASAARACALLLRTLGPRDRFAVEAFDEVVEWMPGGFLQADEGGVERGEKWLRAIAARGGTELNLAMSRPAGCPSWSCSRTARWATNPVSSSACSASWGRRACSRWASTRP
jgi:Ca-activated chloride channel family protein